MSEKVFTVLGIVGSRTITTDRVHVPLSGLADGYGFRLLDFKIWPSTDLGGANKNQELYAVINRDPGFAPDPFNPDFGVPGFLAVSTWGSGPFVLAVGAPSTRGSQSIINDDVILTQDVFVYCSDPADNKINYFLRFERMRISAGAEAVANFETVLMRE